MAIFIDGVIKHLLGKIAKQPIIIDLAPYKYDLYLYAREQTEDKTKPKRTVTLKEE